MNMPTTRRLAVVAALACAATIRADADRATPGTPEYRRQLKHLEGLLSHDPEDLRLGVQYRLLAIRGDDYERCITFLERLTKSKMSGPNAFLTRALAYIDKVPVSGKLRRIFLARDAIHSLTLSIERRPGVVSYYIRGLVNLYFDSAPVNYLRSGVSDLQRAIELRNLADPRPYHVRLYVTLGDGYWRLHERAEARRIWQAALEEFPGSPELAARLNPDNREVARLIDRVFDSDRRVDTSLSELFSDLPSP